MGYIRLITHLLIVYQLPGGHPSSKAFFFPEGFICRWFNSRIGVVFLLFGCGSSSPIQKFERCFRNEEINWAFLCSSSQCRFPQKNTKKSHQIQQYETPLHCCILLRVSSIPRITLQETKYISHQNGKDSEQSLESAWLKALKVGDIWTFPGGLVWLSGWWFQPLWKILVTSQIGNLPQIVVKIKKIFQTTNQLCFICMILFAMGSERRLTWDSFQKRHALLKASIFEKGFWGLKIRKVATIKVTDFSHKTRHQPKETPEKNTVTWNNPLKKWEKPEPSPRDNNTCQSLGARFAMIFPCNFRFLWWTPK